LGEPWRRYLVVLALILIVFFILPVVPVTSGNGLFVGRSPNCKSSADAGCGVTQTGVTLQGYASASYALFGVGFPTYYFTTTTIILPTEENAPTGQVFGHTAYTLTVSGSLDTLRAEANTTSGTVRYGCAYLIPNEVVRNLTTHPSYTTFVFYDGTMVQFANC
jgi:hypothetical protein